MVLLHWASSGLTTNVVQCWDIVCCLMADVSQTGNAPGSTTICRREGLESKVEVFRHLSWHPAHAGRRASAWSTRAG